MLNAKSGVSAKEIQRNTGVTYKTAYYVCMRIRIGMLIDETKLNGIIEMDESYFGGKARKQNHKISDSDPTLASVTTKRGRGTNKVSVVGRTFKGNELKKFLINALNQEKELEHWKAISTQEVKEIAYGG